MNRQQRKSYLRELGIKHTPRGRFCGACRRRVFVVVVGAGEPFLIDHRGRGCS